MKINTVTEVLWGDKARVRTLLIAALILLLTTLGTRDIWTQEHRWADIVAGMFYRHDFLHPYLGNSTYYDKPLLSYWLIAITAKIVGGLNMWALRLPSALAGVLAVWSTYQIGLQLQGRRLGLLAGWMLLTSFYFVFWARTSSADMLNLGGTTFAIAWYLSKRHQAGFVDYAVFFLIIAVTSLCKGLTGAIVPCIAVLVDMAYENSWRQHLRLPLLLALIPAAILYALPFWASTYFNGETYTQNGLYLVYRENILRYFQPFDHKGPLYTYFLYLPIYMLPWAVFFIPALFSVKSRWRSMSPSMRWLCLTLLTLFVFFTLSGSRRDYYVLPLVPFAILFTADWMLSGKWAAAQKRLWTWVIIASYVLLFVVFDVLQGLYYAQYGVSRFASTLQAEANQVKPWHDWRVVLLDPESKVNFYLGLPPTVVSYPMKKEGEPRSVEAARQWAEKVPVDKTGETIYISRKLYVPLLQPMFANYQMVDIPSVPWLPKQAENDPVAFVPK